MKHPLNKKQSTRRLNQLMDDLGLSRSAANRVWNDIREVAWILYKPPRLRTDAIRKRLQSLDNKPDSNFSADKPPKSDLWPWLGIEFAEDWPPLARSPADLRIRINEALSAFGGMSDFELQNKGGRVSDERFIRFVAAMKRLYLRYGGQSQSVTYNALESNYSGDLHDFVQTIVDYLEPPRSQSSMSVATALRYVQDADRYLEESSAEEFDAAFPNFGIEQNQ